MAFGSGGATLSVGLKERLLARAAQRLITDVAGASETGVQMGVASTAGSVSTGTFVPGPGTVVVSADLTRVLEPGDEEVGWLAQRGSVPLGYLGDAEKSARTFPVIDGEHYSVPGDRARVLADGEIELLGRDSVTINSGRREDLRRGGRAGHHRPPRRGRRGGGRPPQRALGPGGSGHRAGRRRAQVTSAEELLDEAGKHVARFKLPKAFAFLPHIVRSPAGKADYRWARERALEA